MHKQRKKLSRKYFDFKIKVSEENPETLCIGEGVSIPVKDG